MADGELNRYFYQLIYSCLDWDAKQYVPGFEIYQRDLNCRTAITFSVEAIYSLVRRERAQYCTAGAHSISISCRHIVPAVLRVKNLEDEAFIFLQIYRRVQKGNSGNLLSLPECTGADPSEAPKIRMRI